MWIGRVTQVNESCHKLSVFQFNASHVNIFGAGAQRRGAPMPARAIPNQPRPESQNRESMQIFASQICPSFASDFSFVCQFPVPLAFFLPGGSFFCFWCLRVFTVFLVSPDFLVLFASGFFVVVYWSPRVPYYLYRLSTPRVSTSGRGYNSMINLYPRTTHFFVCLQSVFSQRETAGNLDIFEKSNSSSLPVENELCRTHKEWVVSHTQIERICRRYECDTLHIWMGHELLCFWMGHSFLFFWRHGITCRLAL